MKKKKQQPINTKPSEHFKKSNRTIKEIVDISNTTHVHYRSISWLGTGTSIGSGVLSLYHGLKHLVYWKDVVMQVFSIFG